MHARTHAPPQVSGGGWAECSPLHRSLFPQPPANASVTPRHTVSGAPCALPFFYRGETEGDWGSGQGG